MYFLPLFTTDKTNELNMLNEVGFGGGGGEVVKNKRQGKAPFLSLFPSSPQFPFARSRQFLAFVPAILRVLTTITAKGLLSV